MSADASPLGGFFMPFAFINFAGQGVHDVKSTVKRLRESEKAMQAAGGRKIGAWWTLGPYDIVLVAEGRMTRLSPALPWLLPYNAKSAR
jgi:uncharacterized protein with GYD domain